MEDVNTRKRFSFSFSELTDNPLEFNSRKIANIWQIKCWNKTDKVWNNANSLFGCRFRSRCRRRCFSSLISPVHNVPLKEGGQIQTYCSSLNCWQVAPFLQGFGSHLLMAGNEEIEIYFSINSLLIGLLD